ncbi:isopeptide-forming domain-containing fimbrial protein [Nocardioides sp.]|uniref:isopeptide-forming domain-containing fimbrial protein n=1 Tax=Nocardioides sp. TaxID=35761 RepID=UPI003784ABB1
MLSTTRARHRRGITRLTAAPGLVPTVVLALVAGMLGLVGVALVAAPAQAAGTPDLDLSGGPATSVLYGKTVPVDLVAALPAGAPKGYNLAYRVVLPAGVSYVGGSAGNDGEPTVYTNAPSSGKTTLVWPNVDDLVASSSHTLSFQVDYTRSTATPGSKYDVGDTIAIDSGAYISTDPRDETDFDSLGQAQPGPDSYTGSDTLSTSTSLTAIQIRKSEPHPEGEIPRGVHDHHAIYTLTVTNNDVNPTNGVQVDDYIPAGLEFLGCAGTTDHTTDAPTNPGSAQEYPGSGPIVVTHPTLAEDCVVPDVVETVDTDPDGSGPLPSGVYTHVRWTNVGDFAASQVRRISYATGIPIRENTMTWSGATPGTTGAQASNLDNNSGPETYDEQPLLNGAVAQGTYQSKVKAPFTVSDEGTLLRTAEDIAIQKSNNLATLNQGDLTKWTVDVQVSEYRYVTDLVIHDVSPNGLCPLGATNLTHDPTAQDAECDPVAGKDPSSPYTTVEEQGNGTFDMTWDKSTFPSLAKIQPSDTRQLTFWTRTRTNYQGGFQNTTPVLSRDAVHNDIDTHGEDWIRCTAPNSPDCQPGSGTKIDADEADGTTDYDVSGSGKAATGPTILKTVADVYPGSGDCNDATYGKTVPLYGPGDFVCWKLRLDFPDNLDTTSQDVFDILPSGVDYVPGTWQTTAANDVPVGAIDTSTAGRLSWPIGGGGSDVDAGGRTFEVTIKTTVGPPTGHHSGDVEGNLQKFSYENTPGTAFTLRDRTDFQLKMPQLALVKGVKQVDGGTVFGPNSDHKEVQGGSLVTYRVDVSNTGLAPAEDARVWDVLPSGIACSDLVVGSISDGGTCNAGANRIEWSGIDIGVAAATTLTYQVTVPTGVSPAQSFVNTAGVVEYEYVGNHGQHVSLVPGNSTVKDPLLTPNTVAAQDVSDIYTDAAAVAKTRTTSVTETGNAASNQATIGERIDYTVTTTIPKGTTIYGSPTVVDPINAQQQLVPGSICSPACTLDGNPLPGDISVTESPTGTVTATFPTSWTAPAGHDAVLVLHFSTTVLDVNANTRGATISNKATLTYTDQAGHTKTPSSTISTTVVEPKIGLGKSHTPGGAVAGDQILTYTLAVSAASGTNYSPAHDVVVVDTLPAGTDPVDGVGNPVADGGTVPGNGGLWDATARTITWTKAGAPSLASINPGGSVNLTYQVKVQHDPVGGTSYPNAADATTSSLGGATPGVRTPTSTASTAGDYKAHATDTVTVKLPSLSKTVTPDPTTIGTAVTWHVAVTVPKLVRYYDTTVVDTVPDGLVVDGYGAITCTSGCPGTDPAVATIPVANGASGKLVAAWYLGDLEPANANRVYDLVLTGHVADTYRSGGAPVVGGTTLTNSASIKTNRTDKVTTNPGTVPASYDDTVGPATAATHVREPNLTIDKSANKGPIVKPGESVTYTVVVTNTGNWPAYDTVVTDQPDSELTNVVQAGGASYLVDGWTAGDPDLKWVVPGPLAPGDSVTFTYTAQVKAAGVVQPDAQITNTAAIPDYFGAPKAERDAAPGTTWRDYHGPNDSVILTVIKYADLSLTKTADRTEANGGDVITWTITVTNNGLSPAQNAVVTDTLPGHSVLVSTTPAGPTCAVVTSTLTCSYASIPSGATRTIIVKTQVMGLPPANTTVPEHTHQLTISKVEQPLSMTAGQTTTYDLACPGNGYLADGSVEVMHVDQGTGTAADVHVLRASSLTPNAYRFVVQNGTTGQAQVKLFGTCLPHDTEVTSGHSHGLDVSGLTTQDTGVMTAGRHTFVVPVSPGHHAIDPGFETTAGSVRLVASEPVSGGWSFTVDAAAASRATLSLRELGDNTLPAAPSQHKHALSFQHVVRTVSLPPGESVQRVTCPDGSKGVVATYDLPPGVYPLGNEPQPINRDFRLLNTNAGNVDVTLDLECVGVRTGPALDEDFTITNAASVLSSTYDPDPGNNADSASVHATISAGTGDQVVPLPATLAVSPSGAAASVAVRCGSGSRVCRGSLELTATTPAAQRVVIGTATYRLTAGHRETVRFRIKEKYRTALRHHRLHGLRVRIRS